jgi:prepilin-type N-terminal cleavage/methylation domain-containing protein
VTERRPESGQGFSLVELALSLAIVGLLAGSVLPILTVLQGHHKDHETRRTLANSVEALLGFASANGRLPCPATADTAGAESPEGGGICTNPEGFLPAVTLGVTPIDNQGYALDAWGGRIRYAVADSTTMNPSCLGGVKTGVFTTTNCMRAVTMGSLSPNLSVCNAGCLAPLISKTPAVIYSTGSNFAIGGQDRDERENPNPNSKSYPDPTPRRFISHEPTPSASTYGEFDDIVVWLSPNVLYAQMIAAGRLP